MKKTISFMAGVLMLLIPSLAGAQALPFTIVDSDAATLGKGSAGLASVSSVSYAAFTNAAAVPFSESTLDLAAGYLMWQPSASKGNVMSLGVAYNMKQKLGVAAGLYYGMNPAYDASGFKPADLHAAVGVSYRFIPALSIGANVGYATQSLTPEYSYGAVAADFFLMTQFSDLTVTAGVSNVLGTVKSVSGAEFCIPGSVAVGAGYGKSFAEKHAVEANLDFDYFFSGGIALATGAGYTFNDLVSVRAGYRYGGESPVPSFASVGAGVRFSGIKIDLAYLIAGSDSAMKNTLALNLGYSF